MALSAVVNREELNVVQVWQKVVVLQNSFNSHKHRVLPLLATTILQLGDGH